MVIIELKANMVFCQKLPNEFQDRAQLFLKQRPAPDREPQRDIFQLAQAIFVARSWSHRLGFYLCSLSAILSQSFSTSARSCEVKKNGYSEIIDQVISYKLV